MDVDRIRELLDIMEVHGLAEFEYEAEGVRIRLKKSSAGDTAPMVQVNPPVMAAAPLVANMSKSTAADADVAIHEGWVPFTALMVGTVYVAPKPGDPAFVELGQEVNEDTTLCIIEAMKVMNEIKAETNGVIREIRITNGQPVEFGEVLFLIEPL